MHKFFGIILGVMLIANTAAAMTLSQPVKIGRIAYPPQKGIIIEDASYNTGKTIGTWKELGKILKLYENGIARWGDEITGIYFYYDKRPAHFGGKDITFPVNTMVDILINRIDNNENITLYLLQNDGHAGFARDYVCIGRLPDGKWVKYFDTNNIKKQYLGAGRDSLTNIYCKGDTIIIEYDKYDSGSREISNDGEFRFKWDDAAQWFSVEQIVY